MILGFGICYIKKIAFLGLGKAMIMRSRLNWNSSFLHSLHMFCGVGSFLIQNFFVFCSNYNCIWYMVIELLLYLVYLFCDFMNHDRCFYWWEMVLHHILGGPLFGLNDSEMGKLEKSASIHMPIMFGFLLLWTSNSTETLTSLSLEVLLPRSQGTVAW